VPFSYIILCLLICSTMGRHCDQYATQDSCDSFPKTFNLQPCLGHNSHNGLQLFLVLLVIMAFEIQIVRAM